MKKGPEIHYPKIHQIERGMMCSEPRSRSGASRYGAVLVEAVNPLQNQVLVRCFVGGIREHSRWIPSSALSVVWSIGTYEEALALLEEFGGRLNALADQHASAAIL